MGSRLGAEKFGAKRAGISHEEWLVHRSNGEFWCYCCKSWKKSAMFGADKSRGTGKSSACKECTSYKATACRYGITVEEARQLRTGPHGGKKCEICLRFWNIKLEVDHDHKTGKVRGMLCRRCNGALGWFGDSIEFLKKAIAYLEKAHG